MDLVLIWSTADKHVAIVYPLSVPMSAPAAGFMYPLLLSLRLGCEPALAAHSDPHLAPPFPLQSGLGITDLGSLH